MKILVVTNDFPPRLGGIEQYVAQLLAHLPRTTSAIVLASRHPDAAAFDREFPHPVVRCAAYPMLPTPRLARQVADRATREGADVVVFGAGLPLGLMAGAIRRRGGPPIVAFTHGVEPVLASAPGGGAVLRRLARHTAIVTCVSMWAERRIRSAVGPDARLERLPPGFDERRFHPEVDGAPIRARYGLGAGPVVVSVSRLVPRKGQDRLVRAWRGVLHEFPDARLLIVGGGRDRDRLTRLARRLNVAARVVFTGPVPADDLPAHLAAADVFAVPCRPRWGGLDTEAWGTVFLEAAGVGRAAIAGRAGGAPEAVLHEETGLVVDAHRETAVRSAIVRLLRAPDEARVFGQRAATRARREYTWSQMARRLQTLLDQAAGSERPRVGQRDRLSTVTRA